MTLFWHGHFGVSGAKVKNADLMRGYVQQTPRRSPGPVRHTSSGSLTHDPAVLLARDAAANRKAMPCEHVSAGVDGPSLSGAGEFQSGGRPRGGEGVYRLVRPDGEGPLHRPGARRRRETGPRRGGELRRGGYRAVAIESMWPRPGGWVRKLYRLLISEIDEPTDALIEPLAESFGKNYDIAALVETMLRSNLFFSPAAYRRKVKSPVEFALGIVHALENNVSTVRLGQDLSRARSELVRTAHLRRLAGRAATGLTTPRHSAAPTSPSPCLPPRGRTQGDSIPRRSREEHGKSGEAAARFLVDLFLQGDVDNEGSSTPYLRATSTTRPWPSAGRPTSWPRSPEFQLA